MEHGARTSIRFFIHFRRGKLRDFHIRWAKRCDVSRSQRRTDIYLVLQSLGLWGQWLSGRHFTFVPDLGPSSVPDLGPSSRSRRFPCCRIFSRSMHGILLALNVERVSTQVPGNISESKRATQRDREPEADGRNSEGGRTK